MAKDERQPLAYIELVDTKTHIAAMDRAFAERRLCLISGPVGSGRHALYRYWLTERWQGQALPRSAPRLEDVLFVKLTTPDRTPLSPQLALVSSIRHALDRRLRPQYVVARSMERDTPALYTRRDIHKVLKGIVRDLFDLKIKLLALDNGHLLDDKALNQALELFLDYDDVHGTTARLRALFILAVTKLGDENNLWSSIRSNRDARVAALPLPIELDRLNVQSLPLVFVRLLERNLGANLDLSGSDVMRKKQQREFLAEILRRTRGDWHNMPAVIESLDTRLGQAQPGKKRLLTPEVMSLVLADLKQLSEQGILERVDSQQPASNEAGDAPKDGDA